LLTSFFQPRTAEQFFHYLGDFHSKNIGSFKFDEKVKAELAKNAAKATKEIMAKYGLSETEVANLAKMSLYDIFFLCGKPFPPLLSSLFSFYSPKLLSNVNLSIVGR
jgi:hypothetical protein